MYYYEDIILYHPCKKQQHFMGGDPYFLHDVAGFLVDSAVHCAEKTKGRAKALPFKGYRKK